MPWGWFIYIIGSMQMLRQHSLFIFNIVSKKIDELFVYTPLEVKVNEFRVLKKK